MSDKLLTGAEINRQVGQIVSDTMSSRLQAAADSSARVELGTDPLQGQVEAVGESKIRLRKASVSNPTPEDAHVDTFMSRVFLNSLPNDYQADSALGTTNVSKPNGKYTFLDICCNTAVC